MPAPAGIDRAPQISTHPTRSELGHAAAAWAAERIRQAIERSSGARVMLAAAPSQSATLTALATEPEIDWSRVEFFHMDEYVGLAPDAPQAFAAWLHRTFLNKVPQATFHPVAPGVDPEAG